MISIRSDPPTLRLLNPKSPTLRLELMILEIIYKSEQNFHLDRRLVAED